MTIRRLFTIGYEGSSLEGFLDALEELRIDVVVDVRELPLSRKKGFSKTALGEALAGRGIAYRHERPLGCPPDIRNRLKASGDYQRYFREFNRYLDTQLPFLGQLAGELSGNVALLCYERNVELCHRRSIAEQLRELFALKPTHVAVPA